ncbi:DUF3168 domain-containing protein [Cloacibacillus sp. An23]|uniref:DUF3168 domain-containing protein n=1 Tax=Cloacibacillus sp. An23 TaxID=1965591 RepID=UPI000B3A9A00|nr:DUF3168 domain-containing protein [Cloacibacillus sp. An23]OUO91827.1 hypothetical protein B5F39_11885 [Cloacibacillus sp. An23]
MTDLMKYEALYKALAGNSALMAKISGIYDEPPDDAVSPYIAVASVQNVSDELLDNSGSEVTVDLDVWARANASAGGRRQILEINDLITAAVPSWALYDGIEIMRDAAEPDWWHGVATIRYYDRRIE